MYEFLDYRVDDVMTRDVLSIGEETPLSEVEAIFSAHQFNGLPVVDEKQQLRGLVTKLDLLRAFRSNADYMFLPYEDIMRSPASSVMSQDVQTVTPLAPLTRVLDNLVSTGVKSLPVVDGELLVGIVSREDVLRALHRACDGLGPRDPDDPLDPLSCRAKPAHFERVASPRPQLLRKSS